MDFLNDREKPGSKFVMKSCGKILLIHSTYNTPSLVLTCPILSQSPSEYSKPFSPKQPRDALLFPLNSRQQLLTPFFLKKKTLLNLYKFHFLAL